MAATETRSSLEIKAKLFRGLADPSRLSILEALRSGPQTVGEIVVQTGMSQSNASNHLACLRDCGLVVGRRDGRFVYYQLADERVRDLLVTGERVVQDVATGIYQCTRYSSDG
jgi:ArsR family transcriptional regulator, cadmium/lead-responsive transcriptional repressor